MNKQCTNKSLHARAAVTVTSITVFCGALGCAGSYLSVADDPHAEALSGPGAEVPPEGNLPEQIVDKGNFVAKYLPARSENLLEVAKAIRESELLTDVLPDLNANFALERDLPIVFRECGQANAHYDHRERLLTICYEFVRYLAEGFTRVYDKDEEADEALENAITFFLFHELGHALIDIDKLPATGGAEAAADEFAAFVLMSLGENGKLIALHAAVAFSRIVGEGDSLDNSTLGDEHPLGRQRAFNLICLVYGSAPGATGVRAAARAGGMPETRLDRCAEDYKRMNTSWLALLQSHLKQARGVR